MPVAPPPVYLDIPYPDIAGSQQNALATALGRQKLESGLIPAQAGLARATAGLYESKALGKRDKLFPGIDEQTFKMIAISAQGVNPDDPISKKAFSNMWRQKLPEDTFKTLFGGMNNWERWLPKMEELANIRIEPKDKGKESRNIKTWMKIGDPTDLIYLEGNVPPPKGYAPYKAPSDEYTTVYDSEGRVIYEKGRGKGGKLTKRVETDIEDRLITSQGRFSNLMKVGELYKPEFQEIETRWDVFKSGKKEKLRMKLTDQEKDDLSKFSVYKARYFRELNSYIKHITGVAMSPQEAERITKAMPNVGQGIFDGDSPTEFQAKLDDLMRDIEYSIARLSYIKQQGLDSEFDPENEKTVVPLYGMRSIIKERYKELVVSGMDENQAKTQTAKEFGLSY